MRIGAQLYTARDYCKSQEDFKDTIKKLKAFGYEYVQVSGVPLEPKIIKDVCDEYEMTINVTHINPDQLLKDPKSIIDVHRLYECNDVGIGAMPANYRGSYEGLMAFIKDFKEPAKILEDSGMTFNYHNHSFEFEKYAGKIGFDIMIEETLNCNWYFIFDTYWGQAGGVCPANYIEKLDGRIRALHLKDMAIGENGQQRFAAIGSGNLNWDKIIEVSLKNGIPLAMVEQDTHFIDDPITELGRSFKFLNSKGLK